MPAAATSAQRLYHQPQAQDRGALRSCMPDRSPAGRWASARVAPRRALRLAVQQAADMVVKLRCKQGGVLQAV